MRKGISSDQVASLMFAHTYSVEQPHNLQSRPLAVVPAEKQGKL